MIKISSNDGKKKIFESYHQVCEYLNRIEKKKATETEEIRWMFIRRPHESISILYYASPLWKNCLTPKEKEAVQKKLGLIEIRKGDKKILSSFFTVLSLIRNH